MPDPIYYPKKASPGMYRAFSGKEYVGEYPTAERAMREPTRNREVFRVYDDAGHVVASKQCPR